MYSLILERGKENESRSLKKAKKLGSDITFKEKGKRNKAVAYIHGVECCGCFGIYTYPSQ